MIIYATGFDAITGAFDRIDIRGVDNVSLKDKWKDGPQTFLGIMVDDFPNGKFVTMIYAVLDPAQRTLTFASAGHLPPLLIDGDGGRFLPAERGMPLGLVGGDFSEMTVTIPEGSRIVFYSDGITEAEEPTQQDYYGMERLQRHVMSAGATAESLLEDVRSFADGADLHDDATVIFVRA